MQDNCCAGVCIIHILYVYASKNSLLHIYIYMYVLVAVCSSAQVCWEAQLDRWICHGHLWSSSQSTQAQHGWRLA